MRRRGFTLLEALLASAILWGGMNLLWDGYLTHRKLQVKLDAEVDALTELATVSELIGRDAEATKARPHADAGAVALPTGTGVTRWRDTPQGLVREGADGAPRRFASLRAASLAIETVGPRMVVVARLRGPGDELDTVVARAIPIGSAR